MSMDDEPIKIADLQVEVPSPPPARWVRRLAVNVGLQEPEDCASLPAWLQRIREFLLGERQPAPFANAELEGLRHQAACLAARGGWTRDDLEQLLLTR